MADVVLDPPVRGDLVGAAELGVHAALSGQNVQRAVAASGVGAALIGETLAGDVEAGLAFVLQGTVETQQAVHAESGQDQSRGKQDGGQEAAWSRQTSVLTDGNPPAELNRKVRMQTYFGIIRYIHRLDFLCRRFQ